MELLRIENLQRKKILGRSLRMSLANNRTFELWSSFMPDRKKVIKSIGPDLYSIQIYDSLADFHSFNSNSEFTKFAGVEVAINNSDNGDFESYFLEEGLYAVFLHKGSSQEFQKTAMYIFGQWIPNSKYTIDDRAHFEVLGEKYKRENKDSEEEVWVPIKLKEN